MSRGGIFIIASRLEERSDELANSRWFSLRRRQLRDTLNPFDLNETEFRRNFRLSREGVRALFDEMEPLYTQIRSSSISPTFQIFCALQFFASGSYQRVVGNNILANMSQSSVSRCIRRFLNLMPRRMTSKWVSFPKNAMEKLTAERGFEELGMPRVIGVIDGTHVAIVTPPRREDVYVNRKHYHSINVQIICDANRRILNVNARYPGSSHDAYIWANSTIFSLMKANYNYGERHVLIGDSGYPLQPWLFVPYAKAEPGSYQAYYNYTFVRARSVVERCIGLLKGRFRCLLKDRVLHYRPLVAAKIVTACAVLHNMALQFNAGEEVEAAWDEMDTAPRPTVVFPDSVMRQQGALARDEYAIEYFSDGFFIPDANVEFPMSSDELG